MPPQIRTQTNAARTEFPARSFLFYGEPKVGKTSTAAQFPKPLILNVASENGTGEIAGDLVDITKPADLVDVVHWITADPEKKFRGYQTVVLDGLSAFCTDSVVSAGSRDTRQAVKDATAILRPVLHELLALHCIRVLTGHARRDEVEETIDGRKVTRLVIYPDLPPRLRLFVEGRVDAIAYCYASNGKSVAWWLPVDVESPRPRTISAGNRLGLPKSTDLAFSAIRAALVQNGNGHAAAGAPASGNGKPA
jgi:hypothetical protein